jgi:hypothetical protein
MNREITIIAFGNRGGEVIMKFREMWLCYGRRGGSSTRCRERYEKEREGEWGCNVLPARLVARAFKRGGEEWNFDL